MKRFLYVMLIMMTAVSLCACGNGTGSRTAGTGSVNSVSDVLEKQMNAAEPVETEAPAASAGQTAREQVTVYDFPDVDLTALSSTMVYSEVYNMLVDPASYVGEIVKMNGQFVLYQAYNENGELVGDQIYFACIVADATACCSQGIEFVPAGDLVYPQDFPEVGSEITVVGRFETYWEGETEYCHLVDAEMTVEGV